MSSLGEGLSSIGKGLVDLQEMWRQRAKEKIDYLVQSHGGDWAAAAQAAQADPQYRKAWRLITGANPDPASMQKSIDTLTKEFDLEKQKEMWAMQQRAYEYGRQIGNPLNAYQVSNPAIAAAYGPESAIIQMKPEDQDRARKVQAGLAPQSETFMRFINQYMQAYGVYPPREVFERYGYEYIPPPDGYGQPQEGVQDTGATTNFYAGLPPPEVLSQGLKFLFNQGQSLGIAMPPAESVPPGIVASGGSAQTMAAPAPAPAPAAAQAPVVAPGSKASENINRAQDRAARIQLDREKLEQKKKMDEERAQVMRATRDYIKEKTEYVSQNYDLARQRIYEGDPDMKDNQLFQQEIVPAKTRLTKAYEKLNQASMASYSNPLDGEKIVNQAYQGVVEANAFYDMEKQRIWKMISERKRGGQAAPAGSGRQTGGQAGGAAPAGNHDFSGLKLRPQKR